MSALLILKLLWPLAKDVAAATHRSSEGGKKVTPAEIEEILVEFLPKLAKKLAKELS